MDLNYETLTKFESAGLLLRDFFISYDGGSLKSAYISLADESGNFTGQDWLDIEYDFNALFVGPLALKAAPYASVYLEDEALVMGKATLCHREFMEKLGLSANQENSMPDDHISYVLELAVLLSANARQSAEYMPAFNQYVMEYIAKWVPDYIDKIKINAQTAALQNIAEKLSYWLGELITRVSYEQ